MRSTILRMSQRWSGSVPRGIWSLRTWMDDRDALARANPGADRMTENKRKSFAQLARERLEREPRLEEQSEVRKKMIAEGWLFLGERGKGFVILPPETPGE